MTKQTILQIDNVRIRKWDEQNVFIEREETYFSARDKKDITGYRFKGYYSDVFKALLAVNRKGLLIDKNSAQSINELLKQVQESERKILKALGDANENLPNS